MTNKTTFNVDRDNLTLEMSRLFDAPRDLMFEVLTDPAAIPEWWGPSGVTTTVEQMDVRPGGAWRCVHRDDEGNEYAFHGEYREVVAPERTVLTFEFEGMPGHVIIETTTLEERDGGTLMTVLSQFDTLDDLEGMLASGMESGARESWDRLDALVARRRAG